MTWQPGHRHVLGQVAYQQMADYLRWNDEDRWAYYYLCVSLEGAAQRLASPGTVGRRSPSVDWRHHPPVQTRFGTELQAERFKAELRARRRAPGESLQCIYQDISCLVTLAP